MDRPDLSPSRSGDARDPSTTPQRLRELARRGRAREVAANPNAPADLLLKLAGRHFEAFAANPVLPLLLLEDPGFCLRIPTGTLRRLLRRIQLPQNFLLTLLRHRDSEVRDSARLHCVVSHSEDLDPAAEIFAAVSAAPASHAALGTLLRLELVPVWMLEALAGSANTATRALVAAALEKHPSPEAQEVFHLYTEAGIHPPSERHKTSMLSPSLKGDDLARLARGGAWARQRAAEHPSTPPELLKRLAGDSVRGIRLAALRNRATPAEVLWASAGSNDIRIRLAILDNPCVPETLIEQLAGDVAPRVRAGALRHRLVNSAALDRLASDPDGKVRITVGRHRATSPATLARLAHDPEWTVRSAVARRTHLPPEAVEHLLHDGANIRHTLTRRRDLTEDQLVRLACDDDQQVRIGAWFSPSLPRQHRFALKDLLPERAVVTAFLREIGFSPRARPPWSPPTPPPLRKWRPRVRRWRHRPAPEDWDVASAAWEKDLPHEDYARFVAHPEPQVRENAANNPATPPDLLHRLADDPVEKVRERLAFHRGLLPETVSRLAADASPRVRWFLAYNSCAPAQVLERLADDPDAKVRGSVASNRNTSPEILRRLLDDPDPTVVEALRHNSELPADLVAILLERFPAQFGQLIKLPKVPRPLLERALSSERLAERSAAAENPALTAEDLTTLASSGEPTLRWMAAKHPALPPELAQILAASDDRHVLDALAQNIHTPPETLASLAERELPGLAHHLAKNRATPPAILARFAESPVSNVREAVLYNPALPAEALPQLARQLSPDDAAWFGLLRHPNITPGMVERFHAEGGEKVRQKIAYGARKNPALQLALIRQGTVADRQAYACQKSLSHEAMLILAADPERQIRNTLARHPRLSPEAMRTLLAHSPEDETYDCSTRAAIAFHQNTPRELRLEILRSELARYAAAPESRHGRRVAYKRSRYSRRVAAYTSSGLLLGLLLRPDMPIALFEPLLSHADPAIEQAFLDRTDLPESWRSGLRSRVIDRSLRASALVARICALSAPDCPPDGLALRARNGRWLERYAIAQNPATPPAVLALLGDDSNVLVRAAAVAGEAAPPVN